MASAPARHRTVNLKGPVIPWRLNRRLALLACLLSFAPGETLGEAKGAPAAPLQAAEIRVGSEIEFPPFAVVDGNGQASGFSVDLLRAVAQASGLEPRFTVGPWNRVWNDLVDGNLDVLPIVAISEERRKVVDFGLPHTETFDAFFIRKGGKTIPDLRAADGKTIGVMRSDAAQHELIERGFRGQVALVDTIPDGLRRLAAGEFDAFLCSKVVGILAMQQHGIVGLVPGPPIPDYKRVFAFGLRKGAGDLKERLDQGLLIVKASGEYNRIYERWLSYEDPWRRYRRYLPAALVLLVLFAGLATFAVVVQRRRTLFLRSILDTAQDGFLLVGSDGRILSVNDAACALSGYAREDLLRMTPADLEAAEQPDEVKGHLGRIFATGSDRFLTRQRRKDGTVIDVEVTAQVIPGRLGRMVVFLRDVTSSKQAEAVLRETQGILQASMDQSPAGIAIADAPTGKLRYVNDAGLFIRGGDRETVVNGIGIEQYVASWHILDLDGNPLAPDAVPLARAVLYGETNSREFIIRRAPGDDRVVAARAAPVIGAEGKVTAAVVVFLDITESKRADQAVARSEARYRGLFGSLMDGFVVVDMDGVIRESNEVYRKMLGYSAEELAQLTYEDLTPERWHPVEARIIAEQVLPRGYSEVYEKEYRRKDGTVFPVELRTFLLREDGRPVAIWAIVRDVTEARGLQGQLALSSRLAALGTLVAGVAHEVNNPLAAALSGQDLALGAVRELRDRLRGSGPLDREAEVHQLDEVVEELGDAQEAGRRIERIVKDLKVFGRPNQKDARQRVRLIDVVDLAMRWLPVTIGRTAAVTVENGGAPAVVATAGQITQVVVNLVTNAAKATAEGTRGAIVIRVGPGTPGMARLEVIDHGSGVEPAVLAHIFDPFFTTSDVGKGTGLGLSICHSIVTAHGGTITVVSEVGKGSTFRMELPVAPVEA